MLALGSTAFAALGSFLIHPFALVFLSAPYAVYLMDRAQRPDWVECACLVGAASVCVLILWSISTLSLVAVYLVVAFMLTSLLGFLTRPGRALAILAGTALAVAAASIWVVYPASLVVGLCLGSATLCLQTHWLETSLNMKIDLKDQIALRTQRIRYLLRERDEVTTLAVHDLQSPIQAIAGMQKTLLHMLEKDTTDKASMRQALEVAIETNADLSDRIGSLLNASRDHLGGSAETTSLSRIIDGTIAAHKIELEGRKISVHMRDAAQIQLHNDEDIKDILDVLLDNAIKYTPEDGKIDINACFDAPESVVVIDVKDNGRGVPEKERDGLFLPPLQSHSAKGRTGLGLYLAARRATRLGGAVKHIPASERGAVFRVTLPAVRLEN